MKFRRNSSSNLHSVQGQFLVESLFVSIVRFLFVSKHTDDIETSIDNLGLLHSNNVVFVEEYDEVGLCFDV